MASFVPAASIRAAVTAANDNPRPGAADSAGQQPLRLRDTDRIALLWLPTDGSARGAAGRRIIGGLLRLRRLGLCALHYTQPGHRGSWRATTLGLLLQHGLHHRRVAEADQLSSSESQYR